MFIQAEGNHVEGYQVRVITSLVELEFVRPIWEATQSHPLADYEFFTIIAKVRADWVSPFVIVLLRGQEPLSLLAGRIETAREGLHLGYTRLARISVRQLVLIAGGFLGEKTEANWVRLVAAVDKSMIEQRIDCTVFEQIGYRSAELEILKHAISPFRRWIPKDASEHWFLKLPPRWEMFLMARSRKHRYWLTRLPRILDREFSGRWYIRRYDTSAEASEFIDAAEQVASRTYHRRLGVGFMRNDEYVHRVALDAQSERLRGYVLFIENQPKAFWYCFVYKGTMHLVATGFDPVTKQYELGTVLLMRLVQEHCGTGVTTVDFGLGDADYKRRFGSESVPEVSVRVFSRSSRGLYLWWVFGTAFLANLAAKRLVNRLQATRALKTFWRRRLAGAEERERCEGK